jgi:hypothetical protein
MLAYEAKVSASRYSLMLFFNAILPNLSSDMQHLNQPI